MKKDISNMVLEVFQDKNLFLSIGFSQLEADVFYHLIKGTPIEKIAERLNTSSYSIRQIKRRRFPLIPILIQKKLSFLSNEKISSLNDKVIGLGNCINEYLAHYKRFQNQDLKSLAISTRSINALKAGNVKSIQDLTELSIQDLLLFKNLGRKSIDEIKIELEKLNLKLRE